jgi:membrane protease YdiL (CAAX protease family)
MNQTDGAPSNPAPAFAPGRPGWRQDGPRFALVAWVIATVALMATTAGAGILVSVVAVVRAALGGERSDERLETIAREALGSQAFAWIAVIAPQVVLLACSWLACRALGKRAHERLGLVATGLRPVQGAVVLVATVVPFALGLAAAWLLSTAIGAPSDDALGLQRMWSEGSRAKSVAWILTIAVLPGLAEELFYRGFVQRGLLLRWGPAASVLTSSLLFAAAHGELAWAAAIFPLGVWLGVVAWRTGSVLMTFAMHAGVNGLWTAVMMIRTRDSASEATLDWITLTALVIGVVAFPWAIAILRRQPAVATNLVERRLPWLVLRVAGVAVPAAALFFVLVPAGALPSNPQVASRPPAPTLGELEAGAVETAKCRATGDEGAVEFSLVPGVGTRVELPKNRVGIDEVIVTLDAAGETVWLVYAGERTGKWGKGRPVGIVEQLAADDPTVLCMTLSQGPPPVKVRLTLEQEEALMVAAFERAKAKGWAMRGRR